MLHRGGEEPSFHVSEGERDAPPAPLLSLDRPGNRAVCYAPPVRLRGREDAIVTLNVTKVLDALLWLALRAFTRPNRSWNEHH